MTKNASFSRRKLLHGAGGVALGLPLLPSLLSLKEADAAVAAPGPKRFVFVSHLYGTTPRNTIYPGASVLTESAVLYPGHSVSWGKLQRSVSGTNASVAPALAAPSSLLTDRLVSKMNVMRGWDIPFDINHHSGGHLGNYAANNQGGGGSADNQVIQSFGNQPTIDQIMAYSSAFYPSAVRERFIIDGGIYVPPGPYSFYYQNIQTKSGPVSRVAANKSTSYWFDKLFAGTTPKPSTPGSPASTRKPLVDVVLEDYKALRNGNRRLSAGDKTRLDEFIGRLSELQKKIQAAPAVTSANCSPKKNAKDASGAFQEYEGDPTRAQQKYAIWIELIAAAFACDATRIVVLPAGEPFLQINGDYHNDYTHQPGAPGAADVLTKTNQGQFERCILPLATALDVSEGGGTNTVLDSSLVMWSHEHGAEPHYAVSIPIITFGSAGGFFKTGQYFDFRRKANDALTGVSAQEFSGLTHQRWLATVLQSMGVPKNEWEKPGRPGYGINFVGDLFKGRYLPDVVNKASEVPPMLRA